MSLKGKIALVTGASRGVGRGIAIQLAEAGATVYITGRPPELSYQSVVKELPTLQKTADEITERGGKVIPVYVDHSKTDEVEMLFKKIEAETNGVLDIAINNAFSAVQPLTDTVGKSFWECEPQLWDAVNNVGLRNHYYCSVYAARLMVPRKTGLIVNLSSAGGLTYFFNVSCGIQKCALDRMAGDMAEELRQHNVAMVSLWPGMVRTELFLAYRDSGKYDDLKEWQLLKDLPTESPEYIGKAVVALASDPNLMKKSGRVVIAADAGIEYKYKDIDGGEPWSCRSLKAAIVIGGMTSLAKYVPHWLRIPGWMLTAWYSRL